MYALLLNPKSNLPTIVHQNSSELNELIFKFGFIVLAKGRKKEMERYEEEMMSDMYSELIEQ